RCVWHDDTLRGGEPPSRLPRFGVRLANNGQGVRQLRSIKNTALLHLPWHGVRVINPEAAARIVRVAPRDQVGTLVLLRGPRTALPGADDFPTDLLRPRRGERIVAWIKISTVTVLAEGVIDLARLALHERIELE